MKQIFFVCSSILDGNLISKIVSAQSEDEAFSLFNNSENVKPQIILGPFYKKRVKPIDNIQMLKFSTDNKVRKGIYDDWIVNVFNLLEPANHAYLVFIKRVDDKKVSSPKGIIVIPLSKVRFLE